MASAFFMSLMTGCIRCGILPYSLSSTSLRVDHDHLHFVGPAGHQHAEDDGVQADRLAGAGGAGDEQVRHVGQIVDQRLALAVLAEEERHLASWRACCAALRMTSFSRTTARCSLGISMPTVFLPGIGATMRTLGTFEVQGQVVGRARDLVEAHAGFQGDPNCVMTGPVLMPTTRTLRPKSVNVFSRAPPGRAAPWSWSAQV